MSSLKTSSLCLNSLFRFLSFLESCIPYFFDQMPRLLFILRYVWCGYYSRAASILGRRLFLLDTYKPAIYIAKVFGFTKNPVISKTNEHQQKRLERAWLWVVWRLQQSLELFDKLLFCYKSIETWHFQSIPSLSSPCDFTRTLSPVPQKVPHIAR